MDGHVDGAHGVDHHAAAVVKGAAGEPREMADGHVVFREIPGEDIHEAVNAGDEPWRNIIVELKD